MTTDFHGLNTKQRVHWTETRSSELSMQGDRSKQTEHRHTDTQKFEQTSFPPHYGTLKTK